MVRANQTQGTAEDPSERILLAHGAGGRLGHQLISAHILPILSNPLLDRLDDSAILEVEGVHLAFTTDSYVVDPLFFPGGDIGRLAVCGTVNDLAMGGAKPLYLSLSLIIEEGFSLPDLDRIIRSIEQTTLQAGALVVTGDTKVVGRGSVDQLFINTAGIGIVLRPNAGISGGNAQVGDRILLSGTIGDHGIAVISHRESFFLGEGIASDVAPLNKLVEEMLDVSEGIHVLRDPTRGGLASTLNEIAQQSHVGILLEESNLPIREPVLGACELLGLDPLYVANEGKLVATVRADAADVVVDCMRRNPLGRQAEIIGEVIAEPKGMVLLRTKIGGSRVVDMPMGELLPRIC